MNDSNTETVKRKQTLLVACEGFHGVYRREAANGKSPSYHVKVAVPGGSIVYVGSFQETGKAAAAYDNVVRCFLANKPEGIKYAPSLNYPGLTEPPATNERSLALLPRFLKVCEEKLKRAPEARSAVKKGRPNLRPMVEFNLLTLRDVRLRLSQFQFTPDITETLHRFSSALQGLLAHHKVDVAKATPENPDAVAFQKKIDALVHEANVQRGLAELQRDLPGVEGATGPIGCAGVQCVPAVPTFGDIKCPGDLT